MELMPHLLNFIGSGCDVGVLSSANIAIETPSFDVPFIFGPNSAEAQETADQQFNDFEGTAVHCAQGSPVCSAANHGVADVLPQEPGGYTGFNALYGPKYMNQVLGPILDLDGNPSLLRQLPERSKRQTLCLPR